MFKNKGLSLVEVLVGASIISVAIISIINAYSYFLRAEAKSVMTVQGSYLLEEGIEAVRYLRDDSWSKNISGLSTTNPYYLVSVASSTAGYSVWQATTTKQTIGNNFERTIALEAVYRDSVTQDIVNSGGVLSTSTRKIAVNVSWADASGATTSKSLSTYLTDIYGN